MKWALIATIEQQVTLLNKESREWELTIVEPGTIINIVVYKEGANWELPEGAKLEQVPDTADIGDTGY